MTAILSCAVLVVTVQFWHQMKFAILRITKISMIHMTKTEFITIGSLKLKVTVGVKWQRLSYIRHRICDTYIHTYNVYISLYMQWEIVLV